MSRMATAIYDQYAPIFLSVVVLSAAFYVLESVAGSKRRGRWSRWGNYLYLPLALAFVCALQVIAGGPLSKGLMAVDGGLFSKLLPAPHSILEDVLFAFGFAFVWDVWQYWVHRWQHASPILWQTHKFHHSDADMNAGTQARHHPLSHLLLLVCYAPILFLFGVVTPHVIAAILMFRVWGFVNHADVRIHLGPLTGVITGPQWHRIHHSTQPQHLDKNFATYFPFIDRMFGTYYRPARDEYPSTGLVDSAPEPFLYEATVSPFVWWYRGLRRMSVPRAFVMRGGIIARNR